MNSLILEEIEGALGIEYPQIYKQLYAHGMLNWNEDKPNWYSEVFPTLKINPPLLLFAEDIEIWEPELYKAGILEIKDQEVYDFNAQFNFVPFAKNGAGDLFVFQFDLQQNDQVPIAFIPHDDDTGIVLAQNLQDFIYRALLESLTDIHEDSSFYEQQSSQMKLNLSTQLQTHKPYLSMDQIETLENIYQREMFQYNSVDSTSTKYDTTGLLTYAELEQILEKDLEFEHLNKEFNLR